VLPVLMILVTPFFIKNLGDAVYGQWVLVNSIIASLGILNMGLGDATIRYVAQYRIINATKAVNVANTTYSFYLALAVIGLILSFGYLELEKWFHVFLSTDKSSFIDILKWGILLFAIRLIEQIVFSILKGFERFDLFSKLSISSKVILILTNVLVVFLGYSLDKILIFSVLSSCIFLMFELGYLLRFLPGFSVIPRFDKEVFFEIVHFGLWSWVQSIIGILAYQLDKFLVAYLAGAVALTYYFIGFTIGSQIFNVFVALSNWLFPKISRNDLNLKQLSSLYLKSQFTLITFASISLTAFFFIKNPFLAAWLGEDILRKALPFIDIYCVYILITSITIVPSFFTLGTGNMRLMTANSIVSIVMTGIFMYVMYYKYGTVGLVYGRIVSGLISIPVFLLLFHKFVLSGKHYRDVFFQLLLIACPIVIILADQIIVRLLAIVVLCLISFSLIKKFLFNRSLANNVSHD